MKTSRPQTRVRKHKKDQKNIPGGFVSGNARYKRSKLAKGNGFPHAYGDESAMGKARAAV